MNFKKYHVSKNLANLYNVDKTSLNLRFTTDNNMTIKINGVKGSGMNVIPLVSPGISLHAGQYTVMIKMISGTISGLTDGVFFGINGNTYSQRTTPGILQVGDVGVRAFKLSKDTMLSSIDIAPGYGHSGSAFTDAVFECMLVSGSYTVQTMPSYEPYSSEVWHDTPHYIHNTSTDIITTLPAVIYPNDTSITVGLKGNGVQSATPTPQNPVMPNGTGERTGNLFDESKALQNKYISSIGVIRDSPASDITDYIDATSDTLTISGVRTISIQSSNPRAFCFFDASKTFISGTTYNPDVMTSPATLTNFPENTRYIRFTYDKSFENGLMINSGSTAKPYEPYGYKIPILNNSQTTNVYLGEVQTTRQVKKLVLTGEETWYSSGTYTGSMYAYNSQFSGIAGNKPIYCSHLQYASNASDYSVGKCRTDDNSVSLWIFDTTTSPTSFKAYLADQYANGTPVTVWYVLATSTTGIVNEPLRKIGDYADEVSGITIPTIAGANALSVDTTLQPSEVTVTYKGWHPVADVHEYDSNYTIATMQALTIAQLQTHTISELQGGEWS